MCDRYRSDCGELWWRVVEKGDEERIDRDSRLKDSALRRWSKYYSLVLCLPD